MSYDSSASKPKGRRRHRLSWFWLTSLILATSLAFAATTHAAQERQQIQSRPEFAQPGEAVVLHSASSSARFKATTGTDTFCLYGGPGSLLGKFQDALRLPDDQGWIGVDPTDQPTLWQRSTFNMQNLNSNGITNHGMWAGLSATQQPGWVSAPGYGNNWNAMLEFRSAPLADPSLAQTVGLEFFFNHETEPGYDFFSVDYDSSGITNTVFSIDGSNKDASNVFQTPGVVYPTFTSNAPIVFGGNDYGGDNGDQIILRMSLTSDGAWSDEDGLFPTTAGGAQVDDIRVTYNDGTQTVSVFENFEGLFPYAWSPEKGPFCGLFAKVFPRISDLDPCRENTTPVVGFCDDGTGPFNEGYTGPPSPGTTSVNWSYGVPGGWVVNYNGGISNGLIDLNNEIHSPPIAWDLPGTFDDPGQPGAEGIAGAFIRYSVWQHQPLLNGMFWIWQVRSSTDNTATWSNFRNRSFVYFGTNQWLNGQSNVSDLIEPSPTHVQLAFAVLDLASIFAFPGTDATPAPFFDNAGFFKYRIGGPVFATRNIDLFNDGFPQLGSLDTSTLAGRDALDVRIDMARDISTGAQNAPGDSIIVDITPVIPGSTISSPSTQIKLVYSLNKNPEFEDAIRANAPTTETGTGLNGWNQSEGQVGASVSTTAGGQPVENRYFFDLPDEDFMYPGDVLEYFIQAEDDAARLTTLPAGLSGFDDPNAPYSRVFTIRALPTIQDALTGEQPRILLVNDFGHRGGENDYLNAFGQNGLFEGRQYDTYTVKGPSSSVSNGIGSAGAHGATAAQLDGYDCIVYVSGNLTSTLLSDGTNSGASDKGDDLGVITAWHNAAKPRAIAYFGDNIASATEGSGAPGAAFIATVMGVSVNDSDVRDEIGGQTAPKVLPTGASTALTETFVAYGGCLGINRFDSILPIAGATRTHGFEDRNNPGTILEGSAAGVAWDRTEVGNRKVDVTFPYGLVYVWDALGKAGGESSRTRLLREILDLFGGHGAGEEAVGSDPIPAEFVAMDNFPNPFNPSTEIRFRIGVKGPVSLRIYGLDGRLVKTLLHEQVFEAGEQHVRWNGTDGSGATVASGVYLAQIHANHRTVTRKMTLLK